MTLIEMLSYIGVAAVMLTTIITYLDKKKNTIWMTFVQSYVGALFLFSGFVKVVDPLGTAYKMEEYFDEFYNTFSETWISFIAPIFPFLAEYAIIFSVVMIVFELVLAVMIILGAYRKIAAWSFLLLTLFFTILTGFTFLTGYVGEGVNFFQFSQWGEYNVANMKVTDCGCFGDFIKLEPRTTFLKDVVLLIPSVLFILFWSKMHQVFSPGIRNVILAITLVGSIFYAFSNYVWDIPAIDFRPFAKDINLREKREAEEDAMASVVTLQWTLQNINTKELKTLSNAEYMKGYKAYPKTEWSIIDQIQTVPAIKSTKVSEFEVSNSEGEDLAMEMFEEEGYSLWIISYQLNAEYEERTVQVTDTIYRLDSIPIEGTDSMTVMETLDHIGTKDVVEGVFVFEDEMLKRYKQKVNPFVRLALEKNVKIYGIIGAAGDDKMRAFETAIDAPFSFYGADDILLKTIIRSNPGIVLLKDGKVMDKWHHDKLPDFESVAKRYIK